MERVCDHKMGMISSMEATHLRGLPKEDNSKHSSKKTMKENQIEKYRVIYGIDLRDALDDHHSINTSMSEVNVTNPLVTFV